MSLGINISSLLLKKDVKIYPEPYILDNESILNSSKSNISKCLLIVKKDAYLLLLAPEII